MIERSLYRPILLVCCAVWFGFLGIYVGISVFEGGLPLDLAQRAATYTFSATLCFAAGVIVFAILRSETRLRWLAVFLVGIATLLIHAAVGVGVFLWFPPYDYLQNAEFLPLFRSGIIYDSPIVSSVFVGFIAIHFGLALAEQQTIAAARESAAREAQLAALRHQLSPHFLFNTLNSIYALISEGEREVAKQTLLMLSDFLRFSLESGSGELIRLEEELSSLDAFLAIERVRYEDRLQVETNVEDDALTVLVPPFLLQPLFENIVKHAVARVNRPVHVSLECRIVDGQLVLSVEDDGPGRGAAEPRSPGTGLRNLRERLRLIYGRTAKFEVSDREPSGFRVEVTLETGVDAHA